MNPFDPAFDGRFVPRTQGRAFLERVARRVEQGFLTGQAHFRSRYAVVSRTAEEIVIRSQDFWTDFNVGLNDVRMRLTPDGAIEYAVTFRRWLRGALVLSGALAIVMVVLYVVPLPAPFDIAAEIERQAPNQPAFGQLIFWGSVVWWGLFWPWVLAAMHRGPANALLLRILGQVDAARD